MSAASSQQTCMPRWHLVAESGMPVGDEAEREIHRTNLSVRLNKSSHHCEACCMHPFAVAAVEAPNDKSHDISCRIGCIQRVCTGMRDCCEIQTRFKSTRHILKYSTCVLAVVSVS